MRLLALFLVVPVVELLLLIEVGKAVGTLPTLGLIVATGVLGATLARRQGLGVLARLRTESAAGRLPAAALLDGAMILAAGALLITPGILTDLAGFGLLVPPVRAWIRRRLEVRFGGPASRGRGVVIDQDDVA